MKYRYLWYIKHPWLPGTHFQILESLLGPEDPMSHGYLTWNIFRLFADDVWHHTFVLLLAHMFCSCCTRTVETTGPEPNQAKEDTATGATATGAQGSHPFYVWNRAHILPFFVALGKIYVITPLWFYQYTSTSVMYHAACKVEFSTLQSVVLTADALQLFKTFM